MRVNKAMVRLLAWGTAALLVLGGLAACEPRPLERAPVDQVVEATRAEPQYRKLELENGMKVILISDPEAEQSAASLSVGIGSLSDPRDRPGMAHFLEHMLFLGTEKYPEPEGYHVYMQQHAGFTNAYTAGDHTNYFFQVSHEAFPEALDRFSQFFLAPLFNAEYVAREMKVVDSEHSKNLENDAWRTGQVVRSAFRDGHPISRFSTGSLETLSGVTREEMLAYYRNHYSANLMTLAVIGNQGLDELEALVRAFRGVENRAIEPPEFPETLLEKQDALRLLTVEPIADERSLTITFAMPSAHEHFRAKPLQLLGFLLGHEGEGSLLSLLKAENLASSLSAGAGESTRDYATFDLGIGLTPEGLERYQEVLVHVFSAIRMIQRTGVPHYVFEENQVMAELDFRYRDKGRPSSRVTRLSALMQSVPLEALPEAVFQFERYEPELYQAFLDEMTPDNMLVTLLAQGVPTDRRERYYGTAYGRRDITGEAYRQLVEAPRNSALRLPRPNPFIPHVALPRRPEGPLKLADTTLLQLAREGVTPEVLETLEPLRGVSFTGLPAFLGNLRERLPDAVEPVVLPAALRSALPLPMRLRDDALGKVWYVADWRFRQPKAHMILRLRTGNTYGSPRQAVLAQLYALGWQESLNEFGYPVRLAGLEYGLESGKEGMTLTLSGYAPRMLELLDHLVSRLHEVEVSEEIFASLKERYRRALQNERFGQPYRQAQYYRELLLEQPTYPREALEAELEAVTLAEVQGYARRLYERVYLEGVVAGSLDPRAARFALNRALETLDSRPLPEGERTDPKIVSLPRGADYVFTRRLDINNSLVAVGYEVGESEPTLRGGHLIIGRALRDSFYFNMRTEQQLGYIVFAGMGQMEQTLSLYFLIQSGAYTADTLLRRIDSYIPRFVEEFRAMPQPEFERYRAATIEAKLQRSPTLAEMAQRLMWIGFEYDEKWDHVSEDIRAVQALTREQVNAMAARSLLGNGNRRLAIRLIGKDHEASPPRGTPVESTADLRAAAS